MCAVFSGVGLLVIGTEMVADLPREPIAVKVIGVNLTSGLYVTNSRSDKRAVTAGCNSDTRPGSSRSTHSPAQTKEGQTEESSGP